MLLLRNKVQQ